MRLKGILFLSVLVLTVAGCTHSKPNAPSAAHAIAPGKESPPAPPSFTVNRSAPKAKLQLEAVFEALEMAAVRIEAKTWTDLTVLEAVPHGAYVKKGDPLIKLDTEKLKEQIEDLERERPVAALTYE